MSVAHSFCFPAAFVLMTWLYVALRKADTDTETKTETENRNRNRHSDKFQLCIRTYVVFFSSSPCVPLPVHRRQMICEWHKMGMCTQGGSCTFHHPRITAEEQYANFLAYDCQSCPSSPFASSFGSDQTFTPDPAAATEMLFGIEAVLAELQRLHRVTVSSDFRIDTEIFRIQRMQEGLAESHLRMQTSIATSDDIMWHLRYDLVTALAAISVEQPLRCELQAGKAVQVALSPGRPRR